MRGRPGESHLVVPDGLGVVVLVVAGLFFIFTDVRVGKYIDPWSYAIQGIIGHDSNEPGRRIMVDG